MVCERVRRRVVDAPKQTASVRVNIRHDNVAGVHLPVFNTVRSCEWLRRCVASCDRCACCMSHRP
jgi:vacuolar-type H+-ATPase subunit D/Vma8